MKYRCMLHSLLPLALVLALAPVVRASSTWYVDGVHGSNDNDCKSPQTACKTITHAIELSSPGDSILVAAAVYEENLALPFDLDIVGAGATTTIVDGRHVNSVVLTATFIRATLSRLTFRNGGSPLGGDGGGIYNCIYNSLTIIDSILSGNSVSRSDGYGGGIYNCPGSNMTLINTTISGNTAKRGGAICNGGVLRIFNSTFSGNTATDLQGGGLYNYGTLEITNSTFTGNTSGSRGLGGAIHNYGSMTISNGTISGNTAGEGSGIYNSSGATAVLQNSIVANSAGANCGGSALVTSNGYNLSSDSTCDFNGAGDLHNTDPMLGPLQNNGGPTETMALLPGSPAIDTGNPAGCTNSDGQLQKSDQRGMPRPDREDSGGCDRGAYERQQD